MAHDFADLSPLGGLFVVTLVQVMRMYEDFVLWLWVSKTMCSGEHVVRVNETCTTGDAAGPGGHERDDPGELKRLSGSPTDYSVLGRTI